MPALAGSVLFIEDDDRTNPTEFARDLTSLLQLPQAQDITGVVIGRFQRASGMDQETLCEIIRRQPTLRNRPVLASVDFGHTYPLLTYPIGGHVQLAVTAEHASVLISRH
jgi:muramoyltetrapeptide carboxypeptidase LdcA involved in peptidoglycan recycling